MNFAVNTIFRIDNIFRFNRLGYLCVLKFGSSENCGIYNNRFM